MPKYTIPIWLRLFANKFPMHGRLSVKALLIEAIEVRSLMISKEISTLILKSALPRTEPSGLHLSRSDGSWRGPSPGSTVSEDSQGTMKVPMNLLKNSLISQLLNFCFIMFKVKNYLNPNTLLICRLLGPGNISNIGFEKICCKTYYGNSDY